MKYFSTFSGIGGFELGIIKAHDTKNRRMGDNREANVRMEREGPQERDSTGEHHSLYERPDGHTDSLPSPTCVGYSELDKYASAIYQKHFPDHKNYGDITKIDADALPDFDLLVGGFPCQSFSIAGKRGGFSDTRGTLFFDLARILECKKPKLFLFENVKGLLSHDEGRTFGTIISTLDELGYDLQWQVLNSKNHGVPQNRERVFIIGHLRGTPKPQVFPFGEDYGSDIEQGELRDRRELLQGNVIKRFQGKEAPPVGEPSGQGASDGGNQSNDTDSRGGQNSWYVYYPRGRIQGGFTIIFTRKPMLFLLKVALSLVMEKIAHHFRV